MKKLKSDSVQSDKTPVYMIEFDEGPAWFLVDAVSFDLLQTHLER